jgi:hypothetical protein
LTDAFGAQLAEQKEHFLSVPGKLPIAKVWQPDSVVYEAQVVSYDGSLYQARKDTAQMPGGVDWVCVARGGRDGLSLSIRGAFNVYKKYAQLDVVTFDGASFVAKRDNPGICPGDGWQALALRGKAGDRGLSGPRGMKGERGARGEATPTITHWTTDCRHYRAIPSMSDGTFGAPLELRELFEQFVAEAGHAVE